MDDKVLVDRKFMELVYAVASHLRYTDRVDEHGEPYVNMIMQVKGTPKMADVYYMKEYKPGSDLFVDMVVLVRYMEAMHQQEQAAHSAAIVKRQGKGSA